MTTPATLDQLLRRGFDVRFVRNVNYRVRCEICHWDGTMIAHATADDTAAALRESVKGIAFLDDAPQAERPAPRPRRLYEELRKRGINP